MSKINNANTIDREKKAAIKDRRALMVYFRSKYNTLREYMRPGYEDPSKLRRELSQLLDLLKGMN